MKKLIFLLPVTLLFFSFGKYTTDYPFEKWDAVTLEKANSAQGVQGYTDEEKKVVFYTNLARMNPDLFAKTYFQKYIDSTKTKATSFTRSAYNDLQSKYKPMEILTIKDDLTEEAADHAKDSGKSGKIGHFTSDGKSYEARVKKFKGVYSQVAENCDYGHKNALYIVMSMLIDEAQPNIEHRKNMMEKGLSFVGVSIQPHKKEKWNCVMEFAR